MTGFDPFGDRLARDMRNSLSKTFINLLERGEGLEPLEKRAEELAAKKLPDPVAAYIADRLARYRRAMAVIRAEGIADAFLQALILWDEGLFFEVHERLETQWMRETGERRLALQAMIRAAGVYVHLEQGKNHTAAKMAGRAVEGLRRYGRHLSAAPHLAVLVEKLERLDPHPPFFFKKSAPGVKGVTKTQYADLSLSAGGAARKRVHHNLHPDLDDPVQRLVIAMEPGAYFRPHRHRAPDRWELFTALAGSAAFLLFDDGGRVTDRITLAAAGSQDYRILEIPAGVWHTLVVLKKGTIMLEVKEGPYTPPPKENLAPWAPAEGNPACTRFVAWFKKAQPGDGPPGP